MKKLSKNLSPLIITLCLSISLLPINPIAAKASDDSMVSIQSTIGITPYSDIIEWLYKVENGKLYRRQYNCSKQEWIGEWILCP